jgi:hypothetical protein
MLKLMLQVDGALPDDKAGEVMGVHEVSVQGIPGLKSETWELD